MKSADNVSLHFNPYATATSLLQHLTAPPTLVLPGDSSSATTPPPAITTQYQSPLPSPICLLPSLS